MISKEVYQDAVNIAGSMFAVNAPYATYYGFDPNEENTEVSIGEFLEKNEAIGQTSLVVYDYLLNLKTTKLYKLNKENGNYYEIEKPQE